MNSTQPSVLIKAKNFEQSLRFYVDILEWKVLWSDETKETVCLSTHDGNPGAILTFNHDIKPISSYSDSSFTEAQEGKRIYYERTDLETFFSKLRDLDFDILEFKKDDGFGSELVLKDPDGYLITFWEELTLPDKELMDWYRNGPSLLEESLIGLSEEELDLVRAQGKWSIRQTVFHLIDSDITTLQKIKYALAESGRDYTGNSYDPNNWSIGTNYASRPIHTTVTLFRYMREHVIEMCEHLPGALDRYVLIGGKRVEVRNMLKMITWHAKGHLEQIWETRKVHDIL